jgi:hypothetical protein
MNEEHRRQMQFMKTKRNMCKSSLMRRIWAKRTEIKILKEQSGKDTEATDRIEKVTSRTSEEVGQLPPRMQQAQFR